MAEEHRLRDQLIRLAHERKNISRRDFLHSFSSGIGSLVLTQQLLGPVSASDEFFVARLKYGSGDWNADMLFQGLNGSEYSLLKKMSSETMIRTKVGEHVVEPGDPVIRSLPFLYMTGHTRVTLTPEECENVATALRNGSTLFAEDCHGAPGEAFDKNFRRLLPSILPGISLTPIPMDHELYHCMFDIDAIRGGDKFVDNYMDGYEIDGRLAVIYTRNDLGCAWEGHPCSPGGESQRRHAYEVGMNMATYILTHA